MGFCRPNHGAPSEIEIGREELRELPEYSCSLPTGTTIGKRWGRQLHHGSRVPTETREWQLGEYMECPCTSEREVAIAWAWAINPETGEPHRGDLRGN